MIKQKIEKLIAKGEYCSNCGEIIKKPEYHEYTDYYDRSREPEDLYGSNDDWEVKDHLTQECIKILKNKIENLEYRLKSLEDWKSG